jgi:MFS family permease
MQWPKYLTRSVLLLSLVSLCNDISSEMLYPILPLYLASVGAAPVLMGVVEGIAEMIAAAMKWLSGTWTDEAQRRKPMVMLGYGLSGVSKGLLGLATGWIGILIARSLDRFGKGLRSPARDAMLADNCTAQTRGAVFGFHRSADTLGAVIGPIIALLCIGVAYSYNTIFFIAVIPALLGFACLFFLSENKKEIKPNSHFSLQHPFAFLQNANSAYKKITMLFCFFAIGNGSDMFLLLRLKANGVSAHHSIYFYLLFNIALVVFAYPIGILSDKISKQYLLIAGFLIFATTYCIMAFATTTLWFCIAFLLYGLYYACTDGISKAFVVNACSPADKGKALGTFSMLQSVLYLVAGTITGLLWVIDDGKTALLVSMCIAIIAASLSPFLISTQNKNAY